MATNATAGLQALPELPSTLLFAASTSASTSSIPSFCATAKAVVRLSPVSITMRNAFDDGGVLTASGGRRLNRISHAYQTPQVCPSTAINMTDLSFRTKPFRLLFEKLVCCECRSPFEESCVFPKSYNAISLRLFLLHLDQ